MSDLSPYQPDGVPIAIWRDFDNWWHLTFKAERLDETTSRWHIIDPENGREFATITGPTPADETDVTYPLNIVEEVYVDRIW